MKLIDGTKLVRRKVNQLSNECSEVKSFCCPASGIIVIEVCSKVYCTGLFHMSKTFSPYPLNCFHMIWETGSKNFRTDHNSHILHCEFKLGLSGRNCQIAPTISFIIFWGFSMFYQLFLSPQAKRWAIITYKHGIYELPRKLSNGLRLRILGN